MTLQEIVLELEKLKAPIHVIEPLKIMTNCGYVLSGFTRQTSVHAEHAFMGLGNHYDIELSMPSGYEKIHLQFVM